MLHLWCQKKKLDKIAQAWVRGITIDWKLLHTGGATQTPSSVPLASALPHRVSLPTYPFARERYWVSLSVGTESTQGPPTGFGAGTGSTQSLQPPPSTDASVIHPLVQRNTSTLWEQQFRSTFHGQEFFLTDHVILGQRTLPAVAYLEMARAAVREAIGDEAQLSSSQIDISHVVWLRPLIVEEQPVTVRITLDPLENGTIAFVIRREEPEEETEEHIYCQGRILVGQAHKRERPLQDLDLPALQSRSQHQISVTECHQRYGVALARLRLPVTLKLTPGVAQPHTEDGCRLSPYVLHPSLLDAALQACMGLLMEQPQSPEPHLPFALQDLTIVNEVKASGWAWVSRRSHSATESVFDIDLCDDAGRIA
ncbi:MAG: hypothetical protein E6J34_00365, partial [Chloroflexi bacterium]